MTVKLNHYWSIIPGKHDEYKKFVINKFIPGVNQLGLHTVAVWSVLVGEYSDIVFENFCNDLELIEKGLKDKRYKTLKKELLSFVSNYHTKILINTNKIDSYIKDIREGTIKFNQMWNIQSHKKDEYERFTKDEFIPCLKQLGITIAGEWEVLLGEGPGILFEGRVSDVDNLIINLRSKIFQRAKRQLKQYVENYRSRILTFHIQKIKGYKSASYEFINA